MESNDLPKRLERFWKDYNEVPAQLAYNRRCELQKELFSEWQLLKEPDSTALFEIVFAEFVSRSKVSAPRSDVWRAMTNFLLEQGVKFQPHQIEDLEWCLQQVVARRDEFFYFGWNQH